MLNLQWTGCESNPQPLSYESDTLTNWTITPKIDISPYLSEKSSDFDEILYTAADFELDERHVIKNEKVALDRLRVRQNVLLVLFFFSCHMSLLRVRSTIGVSFDGLMPFWQPALRE